MRETPVFEVRVRQFGVWRFAVATVELAAVAAVSAWGWAVASDGDAGVATVVPVAAALALVTIAAALSLARTPAGVLACREGRWSFACDRGATVVGALTVALDWGAFLLLRIDAEPRGHVWLPVQRCGLERDWHALRCAVHSPPRFAGTPAPLAVPPPE